MSALSPHEQKELLNKLKAGDHNAFKEIYSTYYSSLYLHAYNRLRNREAAKDLVHDLFANIWSRHEELQIREGLSSYLYQSVRNRVIDHISREKYSTAYIQSFSAFLQESGDRTDHLVRERELAALIEREIASLSPQLRLVFEMSRKEHLSHKEIAERLGLSEQTVRTYIKNALRVLRVKLGPTHFMAFYLLHEIF